MTEIKKFVDFRDYEKFNIDFIASNQLLYYHLEHTIERVYQGKAQSPLLYKFFNVICDNCFIVVLLIENECLIYADNINDEAVTKLAQELEFSLFKRYTFFGTKQVIDALFRKFNVEYEEQKHRKIYECKNVTDNFVYSSGQMRMGDITRLEELSLFTSQFNEEYYGDNKKDVDPSAIIFSGIMNDNLYQWNLEGEICAIAQAMHNQFDYPVIGHVFTNPSFRGKGYASSLVHRLTKGLLEAGNEKCILSTNAYTPASNKAFLNAGYVLTGEYVVRYKLK